MIKEKGKAKAKEKAKENVKSGRAKVKEKERGSLREKERGQDLDSVTTAASRTIKQPTAGTTQISGMDLRQSQKAKTELNHAFEMLPTSQQEESHLQAS